MEATRNAMQKRVRRELAEKGERVRKVGEIFAGAERVKQEHILALKEYKLFVNPDRTRVKAFQAIYFRPPRNY
eukprot:6187907-Pleurochrysis_carterae.AAC.2